MAIIKLSVLAEELGGDVDRNIVDDMELRDHLLAVLRGTRFSDLDLHG